VCEERGIECIDLLLAFLENADTDFAVSSIDFHPNPAAHRIIAEKISDKLARIV